MKYYKRYLTEIEEMNDSQYYFYDKRIVERHDYTFEGKEYVASDGTSICFLLEVCGLIMKILQM